MPIHFYDWIPKKIQEKNAVFSITSNLIDFPMKEEKPQLRR